MPDATTTAPPPYEVELSLVATAAPVHFADGAVHIGEHVLLPLDWSTSRVLGEQGPTGALRVGGLFEVDERHAVELAVELLTGVAEMRSRSAGPQAPYDADNVTLGDFEVRLSLKELR